MADSLDTIRSSVTGMAWPALPAGGGATLLALQFQLEQTQWWTPERLRQHQFRQLELLLSHAHRAVPFHRERLDAAGFRPGMEITESGFAALPRLTRADVHALGASLHGSNVPAGHEPITQGQTSGSTGTPVTFLSTAVTRLFWQSFNLRDHLWHRRALSGKLAAIRGHVARATLSGWGPSTDLIFETGPCATLPIETDTEEQLAWLLAEDPDYLLSYASNLGALAALCKSRAVSLPGLREVRSFAEVASPELRALCRDAWGVQLVDIYTAQEVGYVALQCPEHLRYHIQSENLLVEVLDDHGMPCEPGSIGKVVVTTLHNFAMPLVRYEIGDYAEAGPPCPCGRGLPVLTRIMGRARGILTFPTGEKRFPVVGGESYANIAPVRQFQVVQRSLHEIEVVLVVARALAASEEDALRSHILRKLGYPFELRFSYVDGIPRGVGGKFEDFRSELAT
jgi:phenylacetate-coenzyme A ligase PaaK-like adenylate-forming protein